MENAMSQSGIKKGIAYYHCSNRFGCGKYSEQTQLEEQVAEKFKDLQFSDEFTSLVIEKTKRLFLDKRRTYDGRKQALINKKTALEGKRKVAEDKLFEGILADADFTRIRYELNTDLRQIDDELILLEDQKEIDIDVAQEVLLLTRDIYKAYKKASFNLKRQYLSFFWERFEMADGVILKSVPSPLFSELLTAEEAYFKKPTSKNLDNSKVFEGVILYNSRLRG